MNSSQDASSSKVKNAQRQKKTHNSAEKPYLKSAELLRQNKNRTQSQKNQMNKTFEGVVVNNFIKDDKNNTQALNMDDICSTLLIPDTFNTHSVLSNEAKDTDNKKQCSLLSKAFPFLAISIAAAASGLGLTSLFKKSAAALNDKNILKGQRLPQLAFNMNIRDESEFATYMALRNPNKKTIFAMIGVILASGVTLAGKNLIDGIKDIWVKKREADANKYLQENLIDIETRAFAGKLDVIREELVNKANYFKSVLDKETAPFISLDAQNPDLSMTGSPFSNFISFAGMHKKQDANRVNEDPLDKKVNFKNSPATMLLLAGGTLLLSIFMGRRMLKNLAQADSATKKYIQNETEKINGEIKKLVSAIKETNSRDEAGAAYDRLTTLLKTKRANSLEVEEALSQFKFLSRDDINRENFDIMSGIKAIYGDAPETLGGKVDQIQYYCYLDETRGHIYNWIMNPDNPFAGQLFLAFAFLNSAGYSIKTAMEGVQEAAVIWENKNTEKDLQARLVDTEIRNFKSKKQSAIEPMMAEFNTKLKNGASKEELKTMADNILLEIKNGPPFVYA